uniref:A20-type domain-containing protein n=1 Tax=Marmota marmota marmota TaxID=9994 RepID=A0A8C5ZNF6_MARMA
ILKPEHLGIHRDQLELLYKKGCGYYGNPAPQGFCSQCWREEYHRKQIQKDWELAEGLQQEKEENLPSSIQSSQGAPFITFSKFEEKKTNRKINKVTTVKKFFSACSRVGSKRCSKHRIPMPSRSPTISLLLRMT